jgi:hypothetical protein
MTCTTLMLTAMAKERCSILPEVILIVISGQPAQPSLLVAVDLNSFIIGDGHRPTSYSESRFLNGVSQSTRARREERTTGPANRFLHGFESGAPELGERRGRPELGERRGRQELGERRGREGDRSTVARR